MRPQLLVVLLFAASLPALDLKTVAAERDPVKRARMALDNGEQAATNAGKACKAGDYDPCNDELTETKDSVELAADSLQKTGINPSRNPRHFKDAEIRTRKILRILHAVEPYIHPEDADRYRSIVRRVSDINDRLLSAIMKRK